MWSDTSNLVRWVIGRPGHRISAWARSASFACALLFGGGSCRRDASLGDRPEPSAAPPRGKAPADLDEARALELEERARNMLLLDVTLPARTVALGRRAVRRGRAARNRAAGARARQIRGRLARPDVARRSPRCRRARCRRALWERRTRCPRAGALRRGLLGRARARRIDGGARPRPGAPLPRALSGVANFPQNALCGGLGARLSHRSPLTVPASATLASLEEQAAKVRAEALAHRSERAGGARGFGQRRRGSCWRRRSSPARRRG